MKRYGQRVLCLSIIIFISITMAWSGTAAAKIDSSVGNINIQESCTYNSSEIKVGRAPAQFSDPEQLVNKTQYTNSNHIASKDWIALRFAKSNTSSCSYDRILGSDIAYATPADPGVDTTHTVVQEVDDSIRDLEQVSIEYELRPELNGNILNKNISLFGVDRNRDGFIEKSLNDSVDYVSAPGPSTVRLSIDGNATIPSDSYLVVRYDGISNPDYADTHKIKTTLTGNRISTDSGHIRYGANLTGIVKHDTGISISKGRSQLVTLRPSETAVTNGSVYVFLPTQSDPTQPQRYLLSATGGSGSDQTKVTQSPGTVEEISLFDRFAYVFSNPKIKNGSITVRGYTNIAPGSGLSVQVYNAGRLREVGTTVTNSQSLTVNMTLPDELLGSKILRMRVLDYDGDKLSKGVLIRDQLSLRQHRMMRP